MGSAEGFGGGALATEVGRQLGSVCSSGVQKENQTVNISALGFWGDMPHSEHFKQANQLPSCHINEVTKDPCVENTKSPSFALDEGAKLLSEKSGKNPKSYNACSKRSGIAPMEASKCNSRLVDTEAMLPALASYHECYNTLEKTQMVKQRNSSNGRRGDKRNGKVPKTRHDSISLKNGLVSFNSAGGNNFCGIYGFKPEVFEITKYVDEIPLHELLHGNYRGPNIVEEKRKKSENSNANILQSMRKVCSVLEPRKIFQDEKFTEVDASCNMKASTSLVNSCSTTGQTGGEKGDSCMADLSSLDKVEEPVCKMNTSTLLVDLPIYQPKDILERLTLSPPKDLESLLFDAGKPASSSLKNCLDPRLGKSIPHCAGIPPFTWSHSFSGNNKLGADSVKLSATRTVCQGRWVKVVGSTAPQRSSADLLMDLESLTFDHDLVPSITLKPERLESEIATTEELLASSEACSTSKAPADFHSPAYDAAQLLCQMASQSSTKNPHATVKLLKKPSQIVMKACKSKSTHPSDELFDSRKSTMRAPNATKISSEGFPSKKLKLSSEVRNSYTYHNEPVRKGMLNSSSPRPVRPPHVKLLESRAEIDGYKVNHVKKSYLMKPPRASDRPGTSQQKLRQVVPVKWNRPEG